MICLDDCETHQMGRQDNSDTPHDSVLRQLLLGGEKNYANRWYDKALQVNLHILAYKWLFCESFCQYLILRVVVYTLTVRLFWLTKT